MTLDDAWSPPPGPEPIPTPRKCYRHQWEWTDWMDNDSRVLTMIEWCARCHKHRDRAASRRNRNNKKRGTSDEAVVAKIIGGRGVGALKLPWDVEMEAYLRAQCKHLDKWPSVAMILTWLDAIPAGKELRAVTLADTPGAGHRTRRLIVFDLYEWAGWHGRQS